MIDGIIVRMLETPTANVPSWVLNAWIGCRFVFQHCDGRDYELSETGELKTSSVPLYSVPEAEALQQLAAKCPAAAAIEKRYSNGEGFLFREDEIEFLVKDNEPWG